VLPLALLPASVAVSVDGVVLDDTTITLLLRTTSATASCPLCDHPSHHVHSRYARTVRDLPSLGKETVLLLTARKFFCRNPDCPREVFCERLPDLAPAYARSSSRLTDAHRAIAFALGGEAGCRLAARLSMPTSADTLLRRIGQVDLEPARTPRVLGVDDWAMRKGLAYGTILVDLERDAVIDLLPGRDSATLRVWLREHSGVEIISRDRASAYAQAASEAAPDARQVADRWHLLKNVREMLERFFERHRGEIVAVASALDQPLAPREHSTEPSRPEVPKPEEVGRAGPPAILEPAAEVRATPAGRQERFREWIDEQILAGRDNAVDLHRELSARGFAGCYDSVRRFLTRRLAALGKTKKRANAAKCKRVPVPSARSLSYDLIHSPEKRKAEQQARVDILAGIDEPFREVLARAEELAAMLRKRSSMSLKDWLEKAEGSAIPEVKNFAQGIRQDEAAVSAAIAEKWSNGPVEGQVNRLKTIKRGMYGRAGFELLRRRVLHAD
jgi:transposase